MCDITIVYFARTSLYILHNSMTLSQMTFRMNIKKHFINNNVRISRYGCYE